MTHLPTTPIRATLQAEGLLIGGLCAVIYSQTGAGWGLFAVLILLPDLAMLGYLAGNKRGALCYNLAHSYVLPVALAAFGWGVGSAPALSIALVWGAHIGFDRGLGYGLKYASGFKATHLGRV